MSHTPDTPGTPDSPVDPDQPRTSPGRIVAPSETDDARHVTPARSTGPLRLLAILVIIGGAIMSIAGAITWVIVTDQLSDEKIVVADDADNFAGEEVDGPFTAYAQADIINTHALETTDGQTYAQLDQEDPRRDTVMTASFLRASLFTSVVAFGVAAFAFGLGLLLIVIGIALLRVDKGLRTAH
ncbi:MAG TPA: hypothetical protein VFY82_02305 [Acidimicrobiales bacterium]|nr:hypothetical protein [Acidimicrobiales bacterium]